MSQPGPVAACPDPEIAALIGSYELGVLDREEQRRFEEHLLECDHCFQELYGNVPASALLRERRAAVVAPDAPEAAGWGGAIPPPQGRRRRPGVVLLIGSAAAALALVALVVVVTPRRAGDGAGPSRGTGSVEATVLTLAPVGRVAPPSSLDWAPVPGAVRYELRLASEAGEVLWRGAVAAPPADLPEPAREALAAGGAWTWHVDAIAADGRRWTSGPTRFVVAR